MIASMVSAEVFDWAHYITEIKTKVSLSNLKNPEYIALLSSLIGSPQKSHSFLSNRLFGSSLPETLARNCMSKSH